MTRRSLFLAAILAILAALILIPTHWENYQRRPWQTDRTLSYPNSAVVDTSGALIVSDQGGRRLVRIDDHGQLVWELRGGERQGGFYTAGILGWDKSDGVWILNTINSQSADTAERLELVHLSANGGFDPPRWSRNQTPDEQAAYNQTPYYFRMGRGTATYFRTDAKGATEVHLVDLADGSDRIVRAFPDLDAYTFITAAFDPVRSLGWFLDNSGRILEWRLTGEPKEVFSNHPSEGSSVLFPSQLEALADGSFLLFDGKSELVRVAPNGSTTRLLTSTERKGEVYFTGLNWGPQGELILTSEAGQEVLIFDPSGHQPLRSVSGGQLSPLLIAGSLGLWAVLVGAVGAILGLLALFYFQVLRRRTPLLLKQLALFLPIIVLAMVAIAFWVYLTMLTRYEKEVEDRQVLWSQLGAQAVNPADIDALGFATRSQGEIMNSEAFTRLKDDLTKIVGGNQDPWNKPIFDYLYVPAGKNWYVFDQFGYFERYLPKPVMLEVQKTKKPTVGRYQDAYSQWLSGFSPVLRADGSVAALMEVTVDQNIFTEVATNFQSGLAWALAISVIVLVTVTFLSTFWMLRSIQALQQNALRISQGVYDGEVQIRSRDEIEDLGKMFNQMSRQIQSYVERVVGLNRANAKFVPSQFLTYLGKENITEIRLGDQVEREMTVLFSDIRSFTSISESMSTAENFNFINQFLMVMGPHIRTRNGFIDKYIGDAIMALFPNEAEDGLRAAFSMFQALETFNQVPNLKLPPEGIQIGVGLHTGKLMLGIVGEAERFDGTVISDSVNLASRLESLTKYYGTALLTSGQTLSKIADKTFFQSRLLDRVQVKGKTEVVDIHEVLVPGTRGHDEKATALGQFTEALQLYFKGDFALAQRQFAELARICPQDRSIGIFQKRMAVPRDPMVPWTGVSMLDSK